MPRPISLVWRGLKNLFLCTQYYAVTVLTIILSVLES